MPVLPLHPTVPPTDLAGQTNGLLEPRLLVPVGKFGSLHHSVARGWFALVAAAKQAGNWNMTWTPGGTYRPYNDQVTTFVLRYMPVSVTVYLATPATDQRRRVWFDATDFGYSSIYWIKKNIGTPVKPRYPATAAVPGESPHGLACAIDTALDFDETDGITQEDAESIAPALNWLIANARRFGFAWSLQSEIWHIQWVVGNTIPQAVLDYENPLPAPTPPTPPPDQEDEDLMFALYVPTPHPTNGQWWPADYDGGAGPAHFAAFASGKVRRATGPDVLYAQAKNLPSYPVTSASHYNALLHDSGAQLSAVA